MANRKHFTMSTQRRNRKFSDSFKIQKVQEIERGITRVTDICKEYEVTSTNVYRWIDKFGKMKDKKEKANRRISKRHKKDFRAKAQSGRDGADNRPETDPIRVQG